MKKRKGKIYYILFLKMDKYEKKKEWYLYKTDKELKDSSIMGVLETISKNFKVFIGDVPLLENNKEKKTFDIDDLNCEFSKFRKGKNNNFKKNYYLKVNNIIFLIKIIKGI
jgi:hypothetical protein